MKQAIVVFSLALCLVQINAIYTQLNKMEQFCVFKNFEAGTNFTGSYVVSGESEDAISLRVFLSNWVLIPLRSSIHLQRYFTKSTSKEKILGIFRSRMGANTRFASNQWIRRIKSFHSIFKAPLKRTPRVLPPQVSEFYFFWYSRTHWRSYQGS